MTVSLSFDRYGSGSGSPLVLLHGLSGSRRGFEGGVVEWLAKHHGHRQILNVDLRGHGRSPHAPADTYDHASYAEDLAAFIDSLDAGPALVLGHSLGGVVAWSLAVHHPSTVRGVILEDPPLYEGDAARRAGSPAASFFPMVVQSVRALQERGASQAEFEEFARQGPPTGDATRRALGLMGWDPATMEAAISGLVWKDFDPAAAVSCPVTVLRADPSVAAVFTPDDTAAFHGAHPSAEVVLIEGSSHMVHADITLAPYLAALDRFLTACG